MFGELSVSHNLFTFTQSQTAGFLLFLMGSNVCIYLKDLVIMYFTFPTWEIVSLSVWLTGPTVRPCHPVLQSMVFFDWKCFDLIEAQAAAQASQASPNQLSVSKCIFYTAVRVTVEHRVTHRPGVYLAQD